MIKLSRTFLKISLMLSAVLILSACGGGSYIVPISKSIKGNSKVASVSVITAANVKSAELVARVKQAIEKEAHKRLKGNNAVNLKIEITNWEPAWDFNGVKTANTKSRLSTVVSVIDAKTGAVVGKYNSGAFYHNDQKVSAANINVNTHLIDTSAYFMVYELE